MEISLNDQGFKMTKNMNIQMSEDEIEAYHNDQTRILFDGEETLNENIKYGKNDYALDNAIMDLPSDEDENTGWGRYRGTFYSADVTEPDVADELLEAKKLQKKNLNSIKAEDFGLFTKSNSFIAESGIFNLDLELDEPKSSAPSPTITFDRFLSESEISKLDSKKLAKLMESTVRKGEVILESKENAQCLAEFETALVSIKSTLEPTLIKLRQLDSVEGLGFLETKYQLMIGYCANLALYLLLKVKKCFTESHPVVERLVRYRLLLEKSKSLESKMQYTIDRLVNAGKGQENNGTARSNTDQDLISLSYKPNLDMDSDNEDYKDLKDDSKTASYKAPRLAPMRYESDNSSKKIRRNDEREAERDAIIASKSRLLADVQAEMDDAPEEDFVDPVYGINRNRDTHKSKKERFEEENYVRLSLSAKERKRLANLEMKPIDELADLNDFFKSASKTSSTSTSAAQKLLGTRLKRSKVEPVSKSVIKQKYKVDDDLDISDIEDDMAGGGETEFYKENLARLKDKKNYKDQIDRPVVHYHPIQDMENPHASRPASYQMIKNKGVMPKRSKEEENPRVKQRNKWEKAQKQIRSFKPIVNKNKSGPYGGEATGIRTNLSRSVKF